MRISFTYSIFPSRVRYALLFSCILACTKVAAAAVPGDSPHPLSDAVLHWSLPEPHHSHPGSGITPHHPLLPSVIRVARAARPADPAVGANVTFASCTAGTLLASSATGTATYTFGPSDCDGNGFTAICNATGTSASDLNRILISAIASVPILRFDRGGTTASVTSSQLKSTSGAHFKLTNLQVYPVNGGNQTITVTGYSGGVAVPGSAVTINYVMTTPIHGTTLTSTNFGTNYNNIDEIEITTSVIFGVSINDIQTATAVTSLPVSLENFTGQQQGGSVVLNWTTASEFNNAYFGIQRMTAGGAWTGIGRVDGHGTVSTPEQYTFTDNQPLPGVDNYRLQQVDFDGNAVYSPVLAIEEQASASRALTIFPNPVQDNLTLAFNSDKGETANIIVRDMAGLTVLRVSQAVSKGPNSILLSGLGNLARAVYVISVITPTATYQSKFEKGH